MKTPVASRRQDSRKAAGLFILALCLGLSGWLTLPLLRVPSRDAAAPEGRLAASEKSLEGLNSGAPFYPGMAVSGAPSEKGAEAASAAPGGSAGAGESASAAVGAAMSVKSPSTLASALTGVAREDAKPASKGKGWGGETPRSGFFSPPKANFGPLGSLGSGGGSSSSRAAFSVPSVSFGAGKSGAASAASAPPAAPAVPVSGSAGQASAAGRHESILKSLETAESQGSAAAASVHYNADKAMGLSARAFDASAERASLASGKAGAGAGVSMTGLSGVADNLKAANPAAAEQKDLQPPAVPPAKPADSNQAGQQMMGMVMQMLIGGLLGPLLHLPMGTPGAGAGA